jgi:ABC-type transporter Mla subunit MlaD
VKKALAIGAVVAAIVAVVLLSSGGSESEGYVVRGIFDNGSFMVQGEQVRVAGANVGEIESVGVTMPGETTNYVNGKPTSEEGKAVIVMKIEDPGFQDFRQDATCLIRPQSLIGEKYVDCRPTLPRAPGSKPAPPLHKIPSGQAGAGEYLLPVQNNSTTVDPDLINDIQTLPYAQRFRLIFNELGAGLAGRGSDIEAVVKRANPFLRDADRVIQILNVQRDRLAKLASDSEQILEPLTPQKAHVAGFLANSGAAAQATTERGAALEASLSKFPQFLREFRLTLGSLQGFSDAGTAVFTNLDEATPALTEATRALTPFTQASTVALKALGNAGEASGPTFNAAEPVVRKVAALARGGVEPTSNLAKFLVSTRQTGGWNGLADLIYNGTGAVNEYDRYGHFLRSLVALTNCVDYSLTTEGSGCSAQFSEGGASSSEADAEAAFQRIQEEMAEETGGTASGAAAEAPSYVTPSKPVAPPLPGIGESRKLGPAAKPATAPQRALLNYLLGP